MNWVLSDNDKYFEVLIKIFWPMLRKKNFFEKFVWKLENIDFSLDFYDFLLILTKYDEKSGVFMSFLLTSTKEGCGNEEMPFLCETLKIGFFFRISQDFEKDFPDHFVYNSK